jgi:hypothetical protein
MRVKIELVRRKLQESPPSGYGRCLTPPGFVRDNTYKYSEQRNDSNLKSLDENIEHYWKYHPKLFRIAFTVSRLQTVEVLEKDVQPKRGR